MPYVNPYASTDEDERQQPQFGGLLGGTTTAGTTSVSAGQAAPPPAAARERDAGGGSGKFVNFDRIFKANENSANKMVRDVAGRVEANAQQAQQGVGGLNQQWNDYLKGQEKNQQSADKGFNDMANYGDVSKSVDKAASQVNAAGTDYGRQTLAQDMYGKQGNYTGGMSRFDAGLMGAVGGSRFKELQQQFGGLSKLMGDSVSNAGEQADVYNKEYGAWKSGEDAKRAAHREAFGQKLNDTKLQAESLQAQINALMAKGTLSPDEHSKLNGLRGQLAPLLEYYKNASGANPDDYYQGDGSRFDSSQVANDPAADDEYTRYGNPLGLR